MAQPKSIKIIKIEALVVNVLKRLLFLVLTFCAIEANAQTSDLAKFISRNYRAPTKNLDPCKWNYLVLELSTNKDNLLNVKLLDKVDQNLEKSTDFMQNYKVSNIDKKDLPAVLIITIEDNRAICENVYLKTLNSADILREIIPLISKSVNKHQSVKILPLLVVELQNPRH